MQDTVNAFSSIFSLRQNGEGPLSGLTLGVKDLYDIKGHVTGYGNPDWARTHAKAEQNAFVVETLLKAGVEIVGKTHTDEIAYSLMGVNAHYGTPVNTKAPDRVPGGSSSGSVAAVAAGLIDIGLGSDTGGSVRLPASFCGVYGIRTTHGRLSLKGACQLAPSFDTVGWFAQTSEVMIKTAHALGLNDQATRPSGLFLPVDVWSLADKAVVTEMTAHILHLQEIYGPITPIRLSDEGLSHWRETFQTCQAAEIWACHENWITQTNPSFGAGIKERFESASQIAPEHANQAKQTRLHIQQKLNDILSGGKVIIMPTSPAPAPKCDATNDQLNDFRTRALEMLCIAGLGGLPQMNIPAGTVEGGPVGLSLIGAKGSDETLLYMAAKFQENSI